jgi:hypothetical protein
VRVTQRDLGGCAMTLRKLTGNDYAIDYSYGRPRLVLNTPGRGRRDISPRMASGALLEWMHAFLAGWEARERQIEMAL